MGIVREFREFALRGNVMDMAVGIIIGAAFGGIVKALIDDVVMPVVGIVGKADFTNLYFPLNDTVRSGVEAYSAANSGAPLPLADAKALGPVMAYGSFITVMINFIILAFIIFMMIRMMNAAKRRFEKEQAAAAPAAPPEDVVLLREIRDSLKKA
ncbi:MAG: large conductance mechanosensitive channel protein MscL [Phycisphaeraceae bacterium]|nr:large conductance mechanosensitive channel protein MscL [Phycisphaeraceae bacterium]MCW5762749.1 large conductance mechanosensitive channel protein MscL [Phycisphaeraceae bacterium]